MPFFFFQQEFCLKCRRQIKWEWVERQLGIIPYKEGKCKYMYAYYCSLKEGDLVTRSWHIYILFQLDSQDVYLLIL